MTETGSAGSASADAGAPVPDRVISDLERGGLDIAFDPRAGSESGLARGSNRAEHRATRVDPFAVDQSFDLAGRAEDEAAWATQAALDRALDPCLSDDGDLALESPVSRDERGLVGMVGRGRADAGAIRTRRVRSWPSRLVSQKHAADSLEILQIEVVDFDLPAAVRAGVERDAGL